MSGREKRVCSAPHEGASAVPPLKTASLLAYVCITLAGLLVAVPAPASSLVEGDLFQEIDLTTNQQARLKNTGLQVRLVAARGWRPDCVDCPNKATVQVTFDGSVTDLHFALSGNMPGSVMARARRREVHGYVFVMIRIVDDNVRFRIEPVDSGAEE